MDMQIVAAIVGAIIGGAFSAGTGWWLHSRTEARRIFRLRQLFISGIGDDLENSVVLFQRLADDWSKSNTIWHSTINEIHDSRTIYNNNRDWIALIEDDKLRARLAKYYRESANYLLTLNNSQRRKDEILHEYRLLVRDLRRDSGFAEPDDIVNAKANKLMGAEDQELVALNARIPEFVTGLERFRSDAQVLASEVAALKNS